MNPHKLLTEILIKTLEGAASDQSPHEFYDTMTDTDGSRHIVSDDDLLLRWETGDLSTEEIQSIAEHLSHCPFCVKQIGEMIRAGTLDLPESEPHYAKTVAKVDTSPKTGRRFFRPVVIASLLGFLLLTGLIGIKLSSWTMEQTSTAINHQINVPDDSTPETVTAQTQTQSANINMMGHPINKPLNLSPRLPGPPPHPHSTVPPEENVTDSRQFVYIYEERLGGELQPIDPKKWSAFGSINGFLEKIVVFEEPKPGGAKTLHWTTNENEAQWVLILQKSPIGFSLKRKGRYSSEGTGIEQILLKGFSVFSAEPRPDHLGNIEEF